MSFDFTDVFHNSSIEQLRAKAAHLAEFATRQSRVSGEHLKRLDALEYNFGRMLLVLHTLYETALRNGVVTAEQLTAVYQELDLRDGVQDDRLDPSAVPGMMTIQRGLDMYSFLAELETKIQTPEPPQDPEEFLHALEKTPDEPQQPAS